MAQNETHMFRIRYKKWDVALYIFYDIHLNHIKWQEMIWECKGSKNPLGNKV